MTDHTITEAVSSSAEFEAALGRLIVSADENGIDPAGSWVCRSDGSDTDWEAVVVELDQTQD